MERLVMTYLGDDRLGLPVYQDSDGRLWKDVNGGEGNPNLYTTCGDVDGDPQVSMAKLDAYDEVEIVFDDADRPTADERRDYALLSRLQMDCDYFLGYGNRSENRLWANDVSSQIAKMKELHDGFAEGKKPEWLTYAQILDYETRMTA